MATLKGYRRLEREKPRTPIIAYLWASLSTVIGNDAVRLFLNYDIRIFTIIYIYIYNYNILYIYYIYIIIYIYLSVDNFAVLEFHMNLLRKHSEMSKDHYWSWDSAKPLIFVYRSVHIWMLIWQFLQHTLPRLHLCDFKRSNVTLLGPSYIICMGKHSIHCLL